MQGLGLLVYLGACALAWFGTRDPRGRGPCLAVAGLAAAAFGVTFLSNGLLGDGLGTFGSQGPVQFGLILLYGLCYALLPAGLLRPFATRRWAAPVALALAALGPLLGLLVFHQWGDARGSVSGGMGHLGDLLFLSPVDMGEGVTRAGVVTHRFRIHYLVLGVAAAVGVALQLPRDPRARSNAPGGSG